MFLEHPLRTNSRWILDLIQEGSATNFQNIKHLSSRQVKEIKPKSLFQDSGS